MKGVTEVMLPIVPVQFPGWAKLFTYLMVVVAISLTSIVTLNSRGASDGALIALSTSLVIAWEAAIIGVYWIDPASRAVVRLKTGYDYFSHMGAKTLALTLAAYGIFSLIKSITF